MISFEQAKEWPINGFILLKEDCQDQELSSLEKLEKDWELGICQFKKEGEGIFLALKEEKLIGIASIQQAIDAPPTCGIALLQNCYILKKERRKGYGNQLYRHVVKFAATNFGILQLNAICPIAERVGLFIDLTASRFHRTEGGI